MRDFQRSKVYSWERIVMPDSFHEKLTLDECRELARVMYGKRVIVKDGRGRRKAFAFHKRTPTIALPKWARNKETVAHEVAHLITNKRDQGSGHGGIFMKNFIVLLDEHCDEDGDDLIQGALNYGLRVAGYA